MSAGTIVPTSNPANGRQGRKSSFSAGFLPAAGGKVIPSFSARSTARRSVSAWRDWGAGALLCCCFFTLLYRMTGIGKRSRPTGQRVCRTFDRGLCADVHWGTSKAVEHRLAGTPGVRWRTDLGAVFLSHVGMNPMTTPHPRNAVTAMSPQPAPARRMSRLILIALLAASGGPVLAQVRSADLPENASADRYGGRWACDQGYRESDGACIAVEVPTNAYPTDSSYGSGWRCSWGYRQRGESCLAVKPPANAHLRAGQGDSWQCDRGFREKGDTCVVIELPPNAYLSNAPIAPGWNCEFGYREEAGNCVAVQAPANGYLSDAVLAPGWECFRGYRAEAGACVAIEVPPNGYLTDASYGPGWTCDRGYQATDGICVLLQVPANAHIDFSGNDWECNRPFVKRNNACALR